MQNENRQCQNCKKDFVIESEDFAFYDKIKVPPPTFCPECKLQRRMMFRNERALYKRKNNFPGKEEEITSIHNPQSNCVVYDDRSWWSDSWDPMEYGQDYDFSKSFFEQFKELYQRIPLINLSITNMIDCRFCNVSEGDKGCFMISASNQNENCMYGNRMSSNKQSLEIYIGTNNELSYELVNCSNNYKVFWSMHAYECVDSMFLYNCKNCTECIGSVNLRNSSYCIFSQQYSREEYLELKKSLQLDTKSGIENFSKKFKDFLLTNIHKYSHSQKAVDSTGDNIENTNNVKNSFDIYEAQDSKNLTWGGYGLRDAWDSGPGVGIQADLLYDCFDTALQASKNFWTAVVYHSFDIRYSINCHSSSNLFGCHGLRGKQYCILNKQYTKEEYEDLVSKIEKHMVDMPYVDQRGIVYSYGEFFPCDVSPFAYNETIAQEYFPLTKEEVLERGWRWHDREDRNYKVTLPTDAIPEKISEVSDGVLSEVIECVGGGLEASNCTHAFRILPEELVFYKRMEIPLPSFCPNCRHHNRLLSRNPLKLWSRKCMCEKDHNNHEGKCQVEFETSYAPDRPEIVYCEKCYQQEVY